MTGIAPRNRTTMRSVGESLTTSLWFRQRWQVYGETRRFPFTRDSEPNVKPLREAVWSEVLEGGRALPAARVVARHPHRARRRRGRRREPAPLLQRPSGHRARLHGMALRKSSPATRRSAASSPIPRTWCSRSASRPDHRDRRPRGRAGRAWPAPTERSPICSICPAPAIPARGRGARRKGRISECAYQDSASAFQPAPVVRMSPRISILSRRLPISAAERCS